MTETADRSRVAFGWEGQERRRLLQGSSGNGAVRNGIATDRRAALPDSGFSKLGQLILDTLDRGVIALDAAGTVIDANLTARRILDADDTICTSNRRLRFLDSGVDAQLTGLLATLSLTSDAPTSCRPGGFVAHLHRLNDLRPVRILVTPLLDGPIQRAPVVLVIVFDTNCDRATSHKVLRDLYHLTPAQADTAALLVEGHTLDQVAQLLGLSVDTIRSHLKCIFAKCEVHSQSELILFLEMGPHCV